MCGLYQQKGRILNVQHFCTDDGPGIRSVVFLKGCPLSCAWCHNPESQAYKCELMYREDLCRNCGACIEKCPLKLHLMKNGHVFHREGCRHCGMCSDACGFGALEMVGQDATVQEIVAELLTERPFYSHSGGGVTISGGEPMMQPEFTKALLQACKNEGIHTCVETCGYAATDVLLDVRKYIDLFLFDYKLTDDEQHKKYTGVSNRLILDNLEAICGCGTHVILRCPMLPDININENHAWGIIGLAEKFDNIKEIHLEPYHPLGVAKTKALGRPIAYGRETLLDKEDVKWFWQLVQERVSVPVKIL